MSRRDEKEWLFGQGEGGWHCANRKHTVLSYAMGTHRLEMCPHALNTAEKSWLQIDVSH
jgi:hypothetical protein